jgi:glycerate 2-kinase
MIKNREQLLSHGFVEGRKKVLDIIEYALSEVDPYRATKEQVRLEGDKLLVGEDVIDISLIENIYVVGGGKATYPIALALDEILADRITDGFVVVKYGQKQSLKHIRIAEASHPLPDERSHEACRQIFDIAEKAGENDLVFCIITGGSSALCVGPVDGLSFEDKQTINRLLVSSGAEIKEINTVRKHLSSIKGGRLTLKIQPAIIVTLTVSDVVGDPMDWNTDWISPDPSTLAEAVHVLKKYDLWDKAPASVRNYLTELIPEKETPKAFPGKLMYYCMVMKTKTLCEMAMKGAEQCGLEPVLLTTYLGGESRQVGNTLVAIAMETQSSGRPFRAPCALIAGGETVVTMEAHSNGEGGPNQELAIGGCLNLGPDDLIAFGAIDSDGTDGPTAIAGALTDGFTVARAAEKGYDLYRKLVEHDVSNVLTAADDAIITDSTGTNVNDLVVCVVLPPPTGD